jgi:LacI family transcriptional regulator
MLKRNFVPTLSEVARRAGVGTTTVSRVINGGARVNPKTLARVNSVIEELGYRPNHAARVLKGERTRTIGLVVPSIADPFFASCAEAAQAVARESDSLLIVLATQNDLHTEMENLDILISHRVDGMIIAPANWRSEPLARLVNQLAVPVVAIDRPIADAHVSSVITDNFRAARLATEHLIKHGHKRIACLTGETSLFTIKERIRGYRAAMKEAGLESELNISIRDYKSAEYAIESLVDGPEPPDAFFTLKNSTTIYAFEVLQKKGIAVPGQIALLGFDDFELASMLRPSVTVVQQPVDEIGRVAAELLFEQAANATAPRASRLRRVVLNSRLIRRGSCGCTPAMMQEKSGGAH